MAGSVGYWKYIEVRDHTTNTIIEIDDFFTAGHHQVGRCFRHFNKLVKKYGIKPWPYRRLIISNEKYVVEIKNMPYSMIAKDAENVLFMGHRYDPGFGKWITS